MDIPDCDCGGCDGCGDCGDCGDCGGGCDCGDCCAFGAGVATGAAVAGGSKNDNCCSILGFTIIFLFIAGIISAIAYNCSGSSSSSPRVSRAEAAPKKESQNHWKIIEIQRDHRIFGQNHNTRLENTTTQKRKTVQGVLGKVGEVISLEKQ